MPHDPCPVSKLHRLVHPKSSINAIIVIHGGCPTFTKLCDSDHTAPVYESLHRGTILVED